MLRIIGPIVSVFLILVSTSFAAPNLINYQGTLTDSVGNPVDGSVSVTFKLFDAETVGSELWSESQTVQVQNGAFNVLLGSVSPFDPGLFDVDNQWLEIVVAGEALTPRQQFSSAPYALRTGCNPAMFTSCYSGPRFSLGVGICKAGMMFCRPDGLGFETCSGEVLPVAESCDGLDNDCNGVVDDNAADAMPWYLDSDSDNFGNINQVVMACSQPVAYVAQAGDCDDTNSLVYPNLLGEGASCLDGIDNDCDGVIDCQDGADCGGNPGCSACIDADADGYFAIDPSCPGGSDCNDFTPFISPGITEICGDFIDNNCDGNQDEGTIQCGNPLHCPTVEVCNGQDDDCDGLVDEEGVCGSCIPSIEVCDGCDNDCDGIVDNGIFDAIACGLPSPDNCIGTQQCQPSQIATPGACLVGAGYGTCSWNPEPEICDGVDNNCNGSIDDACATVSDQIASVRSTSPGSGLNLPIVDAYVTYVKPSVGGDQSGFTLQGDSGGPAVFIAIDPTTLNPVPVAGDKISLVVTDTALVSGQVWVTGITAQYARLSTGHDISFLVQDLSSVVDIVTNLDSYESELVTITGDIVSEFSASGVGYTSAQIATPAISDSSLQLRVGFGIDASRCNVTVGNTPLSRFNSIAQVTAWNPSEVFINSCLPVQLISARAWDSNLVTLTFSRSIDPSSVLSDGSQFSFNNGLFATAATTSGGSVTVVTTAQVGGATYGITASGLQDINGAGLDPEANSTQFNGYQDPTGLVIAEVFYDMPTPDSDDQYEWVKLYNGSGVVLDLSDFSIGYGGVDYSSATYQLSGSIAPSSCFIVGGPLNNSSNGSPVYDQEQDFSPDIQNSGLTADGVALFNFPAVNITPTTVPLDAVVYGTSNDNGLMDSSGSVSIVNVGDALPGESIRRVGANWIISVPAPNDCP